MQNILVINCGSSSLKYQLLDMEDETLLAKGLVERIGMDQGVHSYFRPGLDDYSEELPIPDHARAFELAGNPCTTVRSSLHERGEGSVGVPASRPRASSGIHRVNTTNVMTPVLSSRRNPPRLVVRMSQVPFASSIPPLP